MGPVLGPANPRIAELRRLIGRRSSRSASVLLEGPRAVREACDAGLQPTTVVVPESAATADTSIDLAQRVDRETEWLVVRDHVFERLAPSVTPQPMLALVPRPEHRFPSSMPPDAVVAVLVDVGDPGNVGTLIRAADAIAAEAVVVVGGADPWGSKAIRASAGSVLRVPIHRFTDRHAAFAALRDVGLRVVGTDVSDGAPHDGGVLRPPVAVVLGSEPRGLDRETDVDAWCHLSMPGRAESLNVAMAGTVLLFETRRVG